MIFRIPPLTASKLAFSRGYVHLVARRVAAPPHAAVPCINPGYDSKQSLLPTTSQRGYATRAVSRPKAHTGRTKAATPRKTTTTSTKKPAAKAVAKKPKAKPKAKTKKRVVKTKPKPKPKPKNRVLSPASQARLEKSKQSKVLKDLKAKSLEPPKRLPESAWLVIIAEKVIKGKGSAVEQMKVAGAEYRSLSPERREHYNHIAAQNRIANEAAYKKFLDSHTPEEIRLANNARRLFLKKRVASGRTAHKLKGGTLKDARLTRRPISPYSYFCGERHASGDFKGMKIAESSKLLSNEWKARTDSEKQPYIDKSAQDRARYHQEYEAQKA